MACLENKHTTVRENNVYLEIKQAYKANDLSVMFCQLQSRHVIRDHGPESQIEITVSKLTKKRTARQYFSMTLKKEEAEKLALNIAPWLKNNKPQ